MPEPSPRAVYLDAIVEWETTRRFADDILHEWLERGRLSIVDRAFLNETFYGVVRNLLRLDWMIDRLRQGDLDVRTRCVLRLGLYQIFDMRVPDHAAVNETVSLAGKRAGGLVNAVLRRAIREREALESAMEREEPFVQLSHPAFLFRRWKERFGEADAVRLCEWNNRPAPIMVRANTLKITAGELARAVPDTEPCDFHPLSLAVKRIPFLWIASGLCYVQDPSTLVACDMLAPTPYERVLDACAAPGGKTSYLAALMRDSGRIVACDSSPTRIERFRENLDRLGVTTVTAVVEDWTSPVGAVKERKFDAILLDAPCSNSGVLRRRADARWRLTEADFPRMQRQQLAMLENLVPYLRQGGRLVYSTCSIAAEENAEVVRLVEERIPGLRCVESREILPFRDGVDGAFAAKFVKEG